MQEQKIKKIPVRQCLGCNTHKPKKEMIRVVRLPDGGGVVEYSNEDVDVNTNDKSLYNKYLKVILYQLVGAIQIVPSFFHILYIRNVIGRLIDGTPLLYYLCKHFLKLIRQPYRRIGKAVQKL